MRVGPFSNKQVIDFIEENFVPLYVSNEEYRASKHGDEERDLLRTIRANARKKNLRAGSVQVFIVTPDLDVTGELHVAQAAQIKKLMPFLREQLAQLNTKSGKKLLESRPQSVPPKAESNELVVRVSSGYKSGAKIVVEDWVVLEEHEWQVFVPKSESKWKIDDQVAGKLLVHLYPYALNWDSSLEQISTADLTAEILEQSPQKTIVSLRGRLDMSHLAYVRTGLARVESELTGFVVLEPNKKPTITLITGGAVFGGRPFEGLLKSMP